MISPPTCSVIALSLTSSCASLSCAPAQGSRHCHGDTHTGLAVNLCGCHYPRDDCVCVCLCVVAILCFGLLLNLNLQLPWVGVMQRLMETLMYLWFILLGRYGDTASLAPAAAQ
ncbi:MAG: hypothetical protein LPD71_09900 [Shewanella sp.]|nr:hypothetical protein [Shewanella sp.]MCF1439037.1 hypothetical protein [Shewanella sp.]MCF1456443.1 hypothetical protein [Shewanella sp.]